MNEKALEIYRGQRALSEARYIINMIDPRYPYSSPRFRDVAVTWPNLSKNMQMSYLKVFASERDPRAEFHIKGYYGCDLIVRVGLPEIYTMVWDDLRERVMDQWSPPIGLSDMPMWDKLTANFRGRKNQDSQYRSILMSAAYMSVMGEVTQCFISQGDVFAMDRQFVYEKLTA